MREKANTYTLFYRNSNPLCELSGEGIEKANKTA